MRLERKKLESTAPLPKRMAAVFAIFLLGAYLTGCASAPKTTSQQTTVQPSDAIAASTQSDPFSVLDQQVKAGSIDPHLVQERVDAARQEWLRALVAQQKNQQTDVVKHFESAIDILNKLITYPGLDTNKDFQEVSKNVIGDYEKYIARIDSLPPNASIFAFREKFNQEMGKMDVKNVPLPRIDLSNTEIPLTINPDVEQSIAYFTEGNGRPFMQKWLARTGKYFPMMKQIMKEEHVPEEIVHLAMMESGLSPSAVSWAKAVGMWQFIDATGSLYGLNNNWWFDKRRDPIAATRAAARFLRDLHTQLGDWHLALAAYDCGANRVKSAEAQAGSTSFWDIRPFLPKETQRYVPLFIATTLISLDPARYGFNDIVYDTPLKFDTVYVKEAIDLKALAKASGATEFEIKDLNPDLLQPSTPPIELCDAKGYCLRLPSGSASSFYDKLAAIPASERRPWLVHTVSRGETMKSIAHLYGITPQQLSDYNNLDPAQKVKRGEHIRVPMTVMAPQTGVADSGLAQASTAKDNSSVAASNASDTKTRLIKHKVKHGETLSAIADNYGVSVSDIREWNSLSSRSKIHKGEMLKIHEEKPSIVAKSHSTPKQIAATAPKSKTGKHWVNYKVRRGETMAKIADEFGVTLPEMRKWNPHARRGVKAGESLKVYAAADVDDGQSDEAQSDSGTPTYHTVLPGETLTGIARNFKTTPDQLSKWNGGLAAADLQAGAKIKVFTDNLTPSKGDRASSRTAKAQHTLSYRVKRGDTLSTIADKFGVGVADLKHANHLHSSLLAAGLRLKIPH